METADTFAFRAIVLAAGAGRRMGIPKASLPWNGVTLSHAHALAALAVGASLVTVVVRDDIARVASPLPDGARFCVSHEDDALGPAGSIRAAMNESHPNDSWIALCPVDVDPAAWACLPSLVAAVGNHDDAAKPRFAGRGGHPVLVRASALAPYSRAEPPALNVVLRSLGARVAEVSVELSAVLSDLDTPEQLEAHLREQSRR